MPPRPRKAPRPYHHGDLRQALLDAALVLLRRGGTAALTLRAVAREAGVSQTAPYRHFADRSALVAGVAAVGFRALHGAMVAAVAAHGAGRKGLQELALAYVRFAVRHPEQYRIMFGAEAAECDTSDELKTAAASVRGMLTGGITQLQRAGLVGPGEPGEIALSCWALVHGVVMLSLDRQVGGAGPGDAEHLALVATELMMRGLAGRALP